MAVERTDFHFYARRSRRADDKVHLHGVLWRPECDARGVVQIVHGMQEYIDRYDDFARFLADNGYFVIGHDLPGHGDSVQADDDLGYFGKNALYLLENSIFQLGIVTMPSYPDVPHILFGHSFGSYLVRDYLTKLRRFERASWLVTPRVDAAILSGCGMQAMSTVNAARVMAGALKLIHGDRYRSAMMNKIAFGHYLDRVDEPVTPNDWLSHNEAENRRYHKDPKCNYTFTLNGFFAIGDLVERTQNRRAMARIPKDLPVLFISGAEDPVGDYGEAVKKLAHIYTDELGMTRVTTKLYDGLRHELLQEPEHDQVYRDLLTWMENAAVR